ncbi:hypothetical protein M1278_00400 [Candidatus Marsarchaeota archaeon]|nr:hypothetical protein [Candidatus Marsarchaeota archaeon]
MEKNISKSFDDAAKILKKIEKIKVSDLISDFSEDLEAKTLVLNLNKDKLEQYKVTEKSVFNKLSKNTNITVSELENNKLKVKLKKIKKLKQPKNKKSDNKEAKNDQEEKEFSTKATRVAFVDLLNLIIFGIPKIDKAVLKENNENEFYIVTSGSNLEEVIKLEGVDKSRCYCNDPFEVLNIYGVEAARNTILNEIKTVLDEENITVSVRHMSLLADTMTFYGLIKSVGRKGIAGKKESVFARAAYEETVKHFINAAVFGEEDKLRGVAENILIGKQIQVGTGRVKLVIKNSDLKKLREKPKPAN